MLVGNRMAVMVMMGAASSDLLNLGLGKVR